MTWSQVYAEIRAMVPGTEIKRSSRDTPYYLKAWKTVDGEDWRFTYIPANKTIRMSWVRRSFEQIESTGILRTSWMKGEFFGDADGGGCMATTIAALLIRVGVCQKTAQQGEWKRVG
jgi:hypothetical protein